ncbi:hypothetical protein ACFC6L_27930, partial [Kitasatospora phosalacinea]
MNWPDDASDWAELGLGPDELALYEALLSPPPTVPTDGTPLPADGSATPLDGTAAAAGLPPQRARAALDALRRAGFVLPAAPGEP